MSCSSYDFENEPENICGACGEKPCSCPDMEEDPFDHPIASECRCGAYYWSVKKGRWMQSADCIC